MRMRRPLHHGSDRAQKLHLLISQRLPMLAQQLNLIHLACRRIDESKGVGADAPGYPDTKTRILKGTGAQSLAKTRNRATLVWTLQCCTTGGVFALTYNLIIRSYFYERQEKLLCPRNRVLLSRVTLASRLCRECGGKLLGMRRAERLTAASAHTGAAAAAAPASSSCRRCYKAKDGKCSRRQMAGDKKPLKPDRQKAGAKPT